jgi:hypothetical protein
MTYIVPPQFQLPPRTPTSPYDCLAYSASMGIRFAKQSQSGPSGRTIRLLSDEPKPDPESPGLNLEQVAAVAIEHFGVYLDVYKGHNALTWAQYEAKREQGRGALIQVSYGPVADSRYDAGRGFRSGHGMYEDFQATDDPLADGRAGGVYNRMARGPIVYDRGVIKRAAGLLVVSDDGSRVGYGNVWCAFTRDKVPTFRVRLPKGQRYLVFTITSGVITGAHFKTTAHGFESASSIPKSYRWPGRDRLLHNLVQVKPDPGDPNLHVGEWVNARFAREV